jgi:pimeloyl-ACP methyl ester carboxylesterase
MNLSAHHPFLSAKAKARYLAFNEQRAKAWPVPFEGRTVETSQGRTFMRISGPPNAPPLVLLPGGGTHSLMWIPNIAGLSQHYRTYALDSVLDVGLSANTVPITSVDGLTHWLNELFDALQLGPSLRLMGLSHGAWLAAHYAHRFPDRVHRLVLLAPPGWVLPISPAFLLSMMQVLLWPRRFFIRRTYRSSLPDLVATGEPGLALIDEMTEELALAFECFGLRRMTKLLDPTVVDDEKLKTIAVPTMYVVGERETIYDPKAALERLARVAPQVKTAVIAGAGHEMTWLKPNEVNRVALQFLDSGTPQPG